MVLGLVTNPANGAGFVEHAVLEGVIARLRERYPDFGGVMGWEYFNALPGDAARPWEWAGVVARSARAVRPPTVPGGVGQPMGVPASFTPAPHPFPAESVRTLQELGFSTQQAVAALNMTGGNVEYAAGMLFQD